LITPRGGSIPAPNSLATPVRRGLTTRVASFVPEIADRYLPVLLDEKS
jgi:hypothetical protein